MRARARLLAIVAIVAAFLLVVPGLAKGDGPERPAPRVHYVVQPGDTLWSIATDAAGTDDVREVVDRIQELNGLQDSVLMPGQVLELP